MKTGVAGIRNLRTEHAEARRADAEKAERAQGRRAGPRSLIFFSAASAFFRVQTVRKLGRFSHP
jgi:hypothetical protein